jgi:hypothetical protein
VNPATSYKDSQLARITAVMERLPPAVLNLQLPAMPEMPFGLPVPLPPLPLALAPLLGTSPQTLVRQLLESFNHQQPAEAVQVGHSGSGTSSAARFGFQCFNAAFSSG